MNEQAGIQAGDGGFDITVKGNTDLKGAYIAGTATAEKNQLTTGTLSFSDIRNHSEYDASSVGVSAGGGVGDGGNNYATHGATSGKNTGGALPLYVSESGGSSATTKSAIGDGSITITDKENQKQDIATLNRDTSNLNGQVDRTPDLQQVLGNQSDLINAAQAASEAIAKQIGNYADKKREEAQKNANATNDPTLKAQYQHEADSWAEGGGNRVALHIAGGALTGGLTGGGVGAVGGAAGAGVSAKLAPQLNDIAQSIKDAGPTGNANVDELLGNVTSNLLAGGAGALVGSGTGALTGASVDRFNRQLHQNERDWAKAKAKDFAKFYEDKTGKVISASQAEAMLLSNGYRLVDAVASKGPGGDSVAVAYISQNGGGLFHATSAEYNNPFLYGNKDGSLTPEQRALPGAVGNPAVGAAVAAAAAAAIGAEPIAGALTAWLRACAANPILCANQMGIAAGELAAGGAMPAGTGAAVVTAAVASRVDDEVAALKGIAQSPAGANLTGKAPRTVLQLQSQRKIEDLAAQYNNVALQPKDFQLDLGGKVVKADPAVSIGAPVYGGATTSDVMGYFKKLAGIEEMPAAKVVAGKGEVFTATTESGAKITLRNFSTSALQSGASWTIDVIDPSINSGRRVEIKFK
ncbi:hypothetical protein WI41_24615 [Burkholderia latens]|uniref:Cell surface protein n=1 Tax=Burkholderia latens TaxID=488446 RepID=A0AAP1G7U9_9BURK|nr:hypothetical protein WI41_24615 [Burkholderia latens]